MTTPSERLPFEVCFRTKEGERPLLRFTEDSAAENDAFTPDLGIVENQDISLRFRAPADFRFTMDGLDVVSVPGAESVDGEVYLPPSDWYVTLFEGRNFPLVPGYYVITVTGRGRTWYGVIEIVPRYLEKQQWQDMRDELLGEIRRLSFDFMKRTMHISPSLGDALGVGSAMLLRFYIVNDVFDRVLHVMGELARTANSRITLRARRIPGDMERKEEAHCRPGRERIHTGLPYEWAIRTETTWNVPENRYAKAILLSLDQSLREFIDRIDENAARVGSEQEEFRRYKKDYQYKMRAEALERFAGYRLRAQQLRNAIREARRAPWFAEAEVVYPLVPDTTVFRDPRYSVLYRLHRHLQRPESSLAVSSFYRFQWKRTDKLYELWCFLTFVKALSAGGWQMESGPAVTEEKGQYTLESLESGTVITMTRGDEVLRLAYDAVVPGTASDTDRRTAPLYTNHAHRRPDMRIDYYRQGLYGGSLVADFKYRDIYRLWNDGANSTELRIQFNAYRDMNTKFYRDMDEHDSLRNSRPVKEVWAVFPREVPPLSDEDYSLRFISLAPGLAANEQLPGLLEDYFAALRK